MGPTIPTQLPPTKIGDFSPAPHGRALWPVRSVPLACDFQLTSTSDIQNQVMVLDDYLPCHLTKQNQRKN